MSAGSVNHRVHGGARGKPGLIRVSLVGMNEGSGAV